MFACFGWNNKFFFYFCNVRSFNAIIITILKTKFYENHQDIICGYICFSVLLQCILTQQNAEMSDLAMANVEALVQNKGDGMLDCPNGCLDMPEHCFCYGYHPYEEKSWK